MSNTRKISLSDKTDNRAADVSERPKRQSIRDQHRSILTVANKDPNYEYRWINDYTTSEDGNSIRIGQRVVTFQQAGWEFVENKEVSVGDAYVYKTDNIGSVVRVPAGQGEYMYLMKIKKEWYDEDQLDKQRDIDYVEDSMKNPTTEDGMYGSVSVDFKDDRKF